MSWENEESDREVFRRERCDFLQRDRREMRENCVEAYIQKIIKLDGSRDVEI